MGSNPTFGIYGSIRDLGWQALRAEGAWAKPFKKLSPIRQGRASFLPRRGMRAPLHSGWVAGKELCNASGNEQRDA